MQLSGGETVTQAQFDISELKMALEHDPEMWLQFHLGDQLTFPVPEFHITGFKQLCLTSVSRLALALPRDHAKTTLAKLAVVWYYCFTPVRFCVYVSNTAPLAKLAALDIVNFLKSENFRAVFGEIEWITENGTEGLYVFKFQNRKCILKAQGAGMQVRGLNIDNQRPQLAVVDDLESEETTDTALQLAKMRRWVYGPFMKALDKTWNKIIWLGNLVNNTSILKDIIDSEDWQSLRYGCLITNPNMTCAEDAIVPLWPDRFTLEDIRRDYRQYQKAGMLGLWFAEMMNLPLPGGNGVIQPEEIHYAPSISPGDGEYGFVTIDPAISQEAWADKTAIVVHMFDGQQWMPVEFVADKLLPEATFRIARELCRKWKVNVIGIENVALQSSLKFFFEYIMAVEQETSLHIVPLTANGKKAERISAWCGLIKEKMYALPEGDFAITQQLLEYNPQKKQNIDDLIDSCAYGPQMLERYMGIIMQHFAMGAIAQAKSEYQIASI